MTMLSTEDSVHNFALVTSRVMTEYCRERFKLPADWAPVVRCDFNPKRKRSWGGLRQVGGRGRPRVPFMSLVLSRYVGPAGMTTFSEYKRFASDPVIGDFEGTAWENALTCLIAHEIAHCVQYTVSDADVMKELGPRRGGHGQFWRNIYAILREHFVNRGNIPVAGFLYAGPKTVVVEQGDHSFGNM